MNLPTKQKGQSSWTQHDYGHSSIFKKPIHNRYAQMFFLGVVKAAGAEWWRFLHNQHHAKPNVIDKDPDVGLEPAFVVGTIGPVTVRTFFSIRLSSALRTIDFN